MLFSFQDFVCFSVLYSLIVCQVCLLFVSHSCGDEEKVNQTWIRSDLHSLSNWLYNNFKTRNLFFWRTHVYLEKVYISSLLFFARWFHNFQNCHQQFIDYGHGLFTTWRSDWFTLNSKKKLKIRFCFFVFAQVEKYFCSKQAQSSIGKCFVASVLVVQVAFFDILLLPPQTHQQDGATSSTASRLIGADRRFVLNHHHLHIVVVDDVEETLRLSLRQRPVADLASHAPFATPRFGWNAFSGHRYHSYSHALYPLEYHQSHVSSRTFFSIIPTFHHLCIPRELCRAKSTGFVSTTHTS